MPIELRHRTYFAYLDVPKDVRRILGRRIYRQTLQTDSRTVAERRMAPLIAQWKTDIAKAREEPNHNDAKFWRDALQRAKTPEERMIVESNLETHVFISPLKKALLTGFHSTAKHNATKAVSPSSETMRTI